MKRILTTLIISALSISGFAQNPLIEEIKSGQGVQFEIRKNGSMAYIAVRLYQNDIFLADVYFGNEADYTQDAGMLTIGTFRGEQLELSLLEDPDSRTIFYVAFADGCAKLYMEGKGPNPITIPRKAYKK